MFNEVYFRTADYAGIGRRALVWVLDFVFVMLLVGMTCGPLVRRWRPPPPGLETEKDPQRKATMQVEYQKTVLPALLLGTVLFAAGYHIGLRRYRGGTLGYRIAGVRLVNARGDPPRSGILLKRFILAVVMTLPFWATYLGCLLTRRRQAFHDILCGTWLVRKRAEPAGPAVIKERAKFVGTWMLTYVDVEEVR